MANNDYGLHSMHLDPELHKPAKLPRGWAHDPLSAYLEQAHRNRFASFINLPNEVGALVRVDVAFLHIFQDWRDDLLLPSLLMIRSHSAYRAACDIGLATAATDVYPELRSCLEYAGYAMAIARDPTAGETWMNRHDDEETLKAVRKKFTQGNVRAAIVAERPELASSYDELYQLAVDYGGHPNERGFTQSLKITSKDGEHRVEQAYFQGGTRAARHALWRVAHGGLCALEIAQLIFPARFAATGIAGHLLALREALYPAAPPPKS